MKMKNTEQNLQSNSLKAFDMIRNAAQEYNCAQYKFYDYGFVKYVIECPVSILIEDIYIVPEFRSTPMSNQVLSEFEEFMKDTGILFYYGRVFKASKQYEARIKKFKRWGMKIHDSGKDEEYTLVSKRVKA